jgi:periplasmic divalent cation tolerance protein
MKTRKDLYKPLEKLLLEQHPYDQPEIVATAIAHISPGYLKWLNEQVQQ